METVPQFSEARINDYLGRAETWRDRGLCQSVPQIFVSGTHAAQKLAKEICKQCPEIKPCLDDAITDPSSVGIRAATSERQRRQLRKKFKLGRHALTALPTENP